jgi:hypothetical protein
MKALSMRFALVEHTVCHPRDSVFYQFRSKVDEQAKTTIGEPKIGEKLEIFQEVVDGKFSGGGLRLDSVDE